MDKSDEDSDDGAKKKVKASAGEETDDMEDDEANMSSNSGWKHLDSDSDSEDMIKEEIGEQIEFNGKFYTNLTKEILSKGTGPRPKQDNEVVFKF